MEQVKPGENMEERPARRIHPLRLATSVIVLAGSILLIVAGGQMLGIKLPATRIVGGVGDSYYHALGLAITGVGLITAVSSVRLYF